MAKTEALNSLDCSKFTIREINTWIRTSIAAGQKDLTLLDPAAMHNLAVGLVSDVRIKIEGSAGYYCAGLADGPDVEVTGNVGWGLAEGMMHGHIVVRGNAGNSAAASIRGGTVVIHGDAGARAGIAMKGGLLLIQGSAGLLSGFMMQKGVMVICGDAGESVASSMYEGTVYVGGKITDLGADTKVEDPSAEEAAFLAAQLAKEGMRAPKSFKKIISARTLWNFKTSEAALWKDVL
jgi:glutamate synthase domain-containing protein 3